MSIQSAPRPTRNASLLSFFVFPVPVTVGVCTTGWAKCCEVRLGESAHIHQTYRTLLSKPPKCACYAAALPISKVIDPHITKHSRSASFSRDCPHYRPAAPTLPAGVVKPDSMGSPPINLCIKIEVTIYYRR